MNLNLRELLKSELQIVTRMNDSGNIKCVATNILGRATTVANLQIEASPRLELPENYNDGLIFRYDEVNRN